MFEKWKEKREQTMARNKAILESKYWREHALLRYCIEVMRGSCTVAPVDMHEAAIAAVNIALSEDTWRTLEELIDIPEDFMPETVYIVWDDPKLPVLRAPWVLADKYLRDIRAVADRSFLVSEYLDRIISFDDDGTPMLYSV